MGGGRHGMVDESFAIRIQRRHDPHRLLLGLL